MATTPGSVGIMPAGALGVAFAWHLTSGFERIDGRVYFVERDGSASSAQLRQTGALRVGQEDAGVKEVRVPQMFLPSLSQCLAEGSLPEIVLICTQPDQLLQVLGTWVKLFEGMQDRTEGDPVESLPILVLASNGIYFQRVRQFLLEKLEESTLLGRLPDLWPDVMPRIVRRLLRGVTIQTGLREGNAAEAVYRPGPRGLTRLAGGDASIRQHVADVLSGLGGWFEAAEEGSPTRVEFNKALVNLAANLLGQLSAIDEEGHFRRMTVREILEAQPPAELRELVAEVVAVGRAVRAYGPDESMEEILATLKTSLDQHADHVPSSLQWIESGLRRGTLQPKLSPTEAWLLEPLIRYAHGAGVQSAAHYFEVLSHRLEHRIALAILRSKERKIPG